MAKVAQMFPSKYLKATDFKDDDGDFQEFRWTIAGVEFEEIKGDDGETKEMPIIYFKKQDKGIVLNKTNAERLATVYGEETDDWTGYPVIAYVEQVTFQGRKVDGIRLRVPPKAERVKDKGADGTKSKTKQREEEPEDEVEEEEEERPRSSSKKKSGGKSRKDEDDEMPF